MWLLTNTSIKLLDMMVLHRFSLQAFPLFMKISNSIKINRACAYRICWKYNKFLFWQFKLLNEGIRPYRIPEAHFGLISKGIDSILALLRLQFIEKFCDIACTKYFMHICKLLWLIRWKVRRKYALRLALSAQGFACCTWRVGRRGRH